MVDAFYAENDQIQVIKNNDIAFDTDRLSVQLFPESDVLDISTTITFPNLISGTIYMGRVSGGFGTSYCESWSSLFPQEWGPAEPTVSPTYVGGGSFPGTIRRPLASTTLGTVPAGTTYLDVRAQLTRTTSPPPFWEEAPPFQFAEPGEWVALPGGSCVTELFYPLVRHFDVVLDGTTVRLDRYQSVAYDGIKFFYVSGNNVSGWHRNSYPSYGNGYENNPYDFMIPAVLLDRKGPDTSGNKRPPWYDNATNPCAAPIADYTSTYSVNFKIHPGRH